jgi:hypothetical protein
MMPPPIITASAFDRTLSLWFGYYYSKSASNKLIYCIGLPSQALRSGSKAVYVAMSWLKSLASLDH